MGELGTTQCVDGLQLFQYANCAFKYTCSALWLSAGKSRIRWGLEWKQTKKTPKLKQNGQNLGLKTFFSAERKHFLMELANRNNCLLRNISIIRKQSFILHANGWWKKKMREICEVYWCHFKFCRLYWVRTHYGLKWQFVEILFFLMFWETEYEAPRPFFYLKGMNWKR